MNDIQIAIKLEGLQKRIEALEGSLQSSNHLTIGQVHGKYKVSRKTIYRHIGIGYLKSEVVGNRFTIPESEVKRLYSLR